jgi:hypothetical protein
MERNIFLELEIFDVGCLYNAKILEDEGPFWTCRTEFARVLHALRDGAWPPTGDHEAPDVYV